MPRQLARVSAQVLAALPASWPRFQTRQPLRAAPEQFQFLVRQYFFHCSGSSIYRPAVNDHELHILGIGMHDGVIGVLSLSLQHRHIAYLSAAITPILSSRPASSAGYSVAMRTSFPYLKKSIPAPAFQVAAYFSSCSIPSLSRGAPIRAMAILTFSCKADAMSLCRRRVRYCCGVTRSVRMLGSICLNCGCFQGPSVNNRDPRCAGIPAPQTY